MPLYSFKCDKCGNKVEMLQQVVEAIPICCGKAMTKLPSSPAILRIMGKGGTRTYSRGYKEGYSKEYLKSLKP